MTEFLYVKELEKKYSGRPIVSGLSFSVEKGQIVGLLGPNGAGKTTAFYMTVGLIKPDAGRIFFLGQDVTHLPMHLRARMGMGYLSQEPSVFRQLTVEENILAILENFPLSYSEQKRKTHQLLSELRLTHLAKKKAVSLSGGERRRLEITRSLATDPLILMLDEPFANIDPISIQEVKEMIVHLKERGISILITDHNAREIFSLVEKCYLVSDGRVLTEGAPSDLVQQEEAKRVYLGLDFRL